MELTEILKQALKAVDDAGVPDSLREVAFREAIGLLSTPAPQPPGGAGARNATSQVTRTSGDVGAAGEFSVDQAYAKLANETDLGEDQLREVILFADDGDVHVLPPARKLGSNVSERARTVTSLIVGARFAALGERTVAITKVRDACIDRSCYDSKNFKTAHLGRHEAVSVRNDDLHVNPSKWLGSFRAAVAVARGVPVAAE